MTATDAEFWDAEVDHPDGVDARVWSPDHPNGVDLCSRLIEPFFPHSGTVLDLGCGIGRLTIPFALHNPELCFVGLDVSPAMLTEARKRSGPIPNVEWVRGDGQHLPEMTLGAAFSVVTLQHVPDSVVLGYLAQLERLLVPDGIFRFQFAVGHEQSGRSFCRQPDQVKEWCEEIGFDVEFSHRGVGDRVWMWATAVKP